MKVIRSNAFLKISASLDPVLHEREDEYAETERDIEQRRRDMGIGDPDIAEQLRKNRKRRHPTSGFAAKNC